MRKEAVTALLIAILLVPLAGNSQSARPKKKSSASKLAPPDAKKVRPRSTGSLGYLEGQGTSEGKSEAELIDMIKSFRLLISQEKSGISRNNYLLGEATAYLSLSKIYRLRKAMSAVDKEREKNSNKRALRNTAEIFKDPKATLEQKTKSLFFSGLAQINLGDFEGARRSFEMAIRLNPKFPEARNMNLYIAESHFEKEKYDDALKQYGLYYKQYNNQQKALAIYKMAWCHLNLQRPQSAEKLFVLLAGQAWAGAFGEDSIKDMAYISSYFRSEQEAIDFSKEIFDKNPSVRIRYLTELYMFFQSQSTVRKKPLLLAELMRIESDPAKKLRLLIITLKASQRGYASLEPLRDLARIRNLLVESKIQPSSPVFQEIAEEFEGELLSLIRSYVDTFSGKVKTSENIKKAEVADHLIDLLKLHLYYFPGSKERENSYSAWLSVCSVMNYYQCIYDTGHLIIKDSKDDKLKVTANLELLRALDELYRKDKRYKEEFVNRLILFLQEQPQDSNWLSLAKRLTFLLSDDKNYKEAIPWLEKIHARENNSESLYRLQWARFENGDFQKVVFEKSIKAKDKFAVDTYKLVREAHLKLASADLEKSDFSSYEKNLKTFIAMSDDTGKADLARKNYINQLLLKKENEKAFVELRSIPAKRRLAAELAPLSVQLATVLIKSGDYAKAEQLVEGWEASPKRKELEIIALTAALAQGPKHFKTYTKQVKDATQEHRDYLLGVLALTAPSAVIEFFDKKPKSESDKKVLLLAYRIKAGSEDPEMSADTKAWLRGVLPEVTLNKTPSKTEPKFKEIIFPKASWSTKKYERFAMDAAERVRLLRKRVVKDIENRPFEVQTEILDRAIEAETKVASTLREAPVPKELDPSQMEQYKKGVEDLAVEFVNQAEEYKKIKTKLNEEMQAVLGQKLKSPPLDKWIVPNVPVSYAVKKSIDEKQYTAGLIALDQAKANSEVQPEDYYRLRSRVLFASHSHQVMADYVKQELESVKQDKLLAEWRALL